MKGHIYQRTKGSWTVIYDMPADPVTGKRRQKSPNYKGGEKGCSACLT